MILKACRRYPGLESKDAAIPTIIYYDQKGRVLSVGVEPEPDFEEEEEDVLKVEWCAAMNEMFELESRH